MDHSQVKTRGDFRTYVLWLANGIATTTPQSLEEYLRALWSLLPRYQTDTVPFSLLAQILHDAFFTEPPPFDEHWLQYDRPPDVDEEENEESFAGLQQMIGYQIADLHRMAQRSCSTTSSVILVLPLLQDTPGTILNPHPICTVPFSRCKRTIRTRMVAGHSSQYFFG